MKPYNKLTKEDRCAILDLYYKHISYKEIIETLGVSERGLTRVLKDAGINTRRKNRYTLDESYFNDIDTEEKAYILGFIYADGYVGDEKSNNVVITLSERDLELLEKIKNCIRFTGQIRRIENVSSCYKNAKPKVVLNFSSSEMCIALRKLGLYPNKSRTMDKLPVLKEELYRHFIRGYFDGDGTISISHKTSYHVLSTGEEKKYVYESMIWNVVGTEMFLDDMKRYLPVKVLDAECKVDGMKYLRTDAKSNLKILFEYLYKDSTIYMKRKYDKFSKMSPTTQVIGSEKL